MEDAIFDVGLTLFIESTYKTRLATQVIGWKKESFVLTKAIFIEGLPAKLKANDACKIRFLKNSAAYGFESDIITVQFYPYPLMFFKYPGNIQCVQCRVAPRFSVSIPAEFLDSSGSVVSKAVMLDISEGGCEVTVPAREGMELSPENGYAIKFKLMDKEIFTGCSIKKIDPGRETASLGMQFQDVTPNDKKILAVFLDSLTKHGSRETCPAPI